MSASAQVEQSAPRFAQVALPVHLRKLFTYRLPQSMQAAARVGSRIVVRLGNKPLTGYIVALLPKLRVGTSLVESELKEVEQLLDVEASLTPDVVELTRWVADYYAAPLGEVMRAALPAGINTSIMQVVSITENGREAIRGASARSVANESVPSASADVSDLTPAKTRALQILADEGEAEVNAFSLRMGSTRIPKWLRELERDGLIERGYRTRTTATRTKRQRLIKLVTSDDGERRTAAQQRAIATLAANNGPMPATELINAAQISPSVIATLKRKGFVAEFEEDLRRDPLAFAELPKTEDLTLTPAQATALEVIESAIAENKFSPLLLHGVTGSGKTEIYIRAMREALSSGRGAMMLVPEIALTPILSRRLRAHFGDQIAIFHSSLSRGERFDEWSRLRTGEARVVLGTRSAVFAPVENLGLIVIDEEQDASYRQEESPFYNARDTAIVRAQKASATVVLGSATPSLESFHNAQSGKYRYLSLPSRIGERSLAAAELIDMRAEFARQKQSAVFSEEVLAAIGETKAKGEQSIILLNRRGYSSFILCRSCGESIMCPNCEVTLTYHRGDQTLVCHYCNHHQRAPSQCPVCTSKYIYYVGEGTEQIEELLHQRFPDLRIGRIDRDTKSRRREFEKTLLDFEKGELDLLVGTQMLAKGHDFPNVTFVGVISVDAGLALPDFRAAERTFQLITQVAGRAGRGEQPGAGIIQTIYPDHYSIRLACQQDYVSFYERELVFRNTMRYPPTVSMINTIVRARTFAGAMDDAADLAQRLRSGMGELRVLGPAPAPLGKLRGEYRAQVLIKGVNRKRMREAVMTAMAGRPDLARRTIVDVDPVSML